MEKRKKSKELSEDLRNQIVRKHEQSQGYKSISKDLNVPVSTMRSVIKTSKAHGTVANLPRCGRKRKIDKRFQRKIVRMLDKEPRLTYKQVQAALQSEGTTVSTCTIRRHLNEKGLYCRRPRKTPLLTRDIKKPGWSLPKLTRKSLKRFGRMFSGQMRQNQMDVIFIICDKSFLLYLTHTTISLQKLDIGLKELPTVLQSLSQKEGFGKSVRLEDMYWNVMKLLGFTRPKKKKTKVVPEVAPEMQNNTSKKKGFLPETKKRKNRKKATPAELQKVSGGEDKMEVSAQQGSSKSKKKKNKKKRKLEQEGGARENSAEAPTSKKAKLGSECKGKSGEPAALEKTKKKKLKQKKGVVQENSKEAPTGKKKPNLIQKAKARMRNLQHWQKLRKKRSSDYRVKLRRP
ncbi:unnamed protein product [Ranitomeya imitator]|uniref:Transposase Tc1-like domain-containing protein n=1 Tax=Ranitomeya imitator TaxID=111125 RepID=A0ABN9MQ73_9NEOB|nr:unnamed protein product [Ranitomeya imitator]